MNIYIYVAVMAVTTYLVRVLPLILCKKQIKNKFIKSILYYVPCACLTAMTFPAILYSSDHVISGLFSLITAVFLAYRGKSLIIVAAGCSASILISEIVITYGTSILI